MPWWAWIPVGSAAATVVGVAVFLVAARRWASAERDLWDDMWR